MRKSDAVRAPDADGGIEHFEHQTGAIFNRAAVGAAALVGAVAEEFVEEVAIGSVDLDAVKTGRFGVLGGFFEAGHDAGDLVVAEFTRRDVGFLAFGRVNFIAGDRNGAGSHRLGSAIEQGMAGTTAMPELEHDLAAFRMHGIGDGFPAFHLRVGVDAGLHPERRIAFHDHRGLGDDQTGAGSLRVVFGHERRGIVISIRTATRERGHEDAVGELQSAGGEWGEEFHGVVEFWGDGSLNKAEPGFTLSEEEEGGEHADGDESGIDDVGALGEEDVEAEDVHDDGTKQEETEVACFR